ncbi:MAG: FAD-dependent thymidylate synthase [Bifidobacteriaceae bacterium]|jgi:thymidylate synthase (FAD)|nr:FAD-dependent thymidylate synthase [Bifidobacteriaceae bacterium]
MAHSVSEAAEQILDKEFKVLDKGFVRLVDYMGSDDRIVQSARVSYGDGTKSYRADAALIDYLLRNKHTSPFEQVILTFHVKLPIFVARQWIRHRTARLNEISGRYSVMKDDFYVPELQDISVQSTDNKQGRGDALDTQDAENVQNAMSEAQKIAYDSYLELVDKDIARELARINLPLSLYTEWYWQIDLHNLFHFIELRLHSHAQKEIRDYAEVLLNIAKAVAPLASESFERHVQNSVTFSNAEMQELKRRLAGESAPDEQELSGKVLERFEEKLR